MKKSAEFSLSVIFPVYNEKETIERVLAEWKTELERLKLKYTIIVCEDGSKDGTTALLKKIQKKYGFILDHQDVRRGYGGAVLDGIRQAPTTHILSVDSDGQCDAADLEKFLKNRGKADVLIGWRTNRADALQRKIFSGMFHGYFNLLFPTPIHDPSAPFVLYSKEQIMPYLPYLTYLREGFWWGFVAMCVKKNLSLYELPMHHRLRLAGDTQVYHLKKIPDIALRNAIGLLQLKVVS